MKTALAAAAWLASAPVMACDVALLLTVDVSGSINANEYRLQMDGLAQALDDSAVAEALVRAQAQVALFQWSGSSRQELTIPWRQMTDFDAVEALVDTVRQAKRPWRHFSTAIGDMLIAATPLMEQVDCKRYVIDVSGDGVSNEGSEPDEPRNTLVVAGVRINALAILGATDDDLAGYFHRHVIGGLNAFVYEATGYEDYPRAIRRKLLDEITEPIS